MISLLIVQGALLLESMKIPYKWGGKCPIDGLDCSGVVSEVLYRVGLLHKSEVLNAQGLYDKFKVIGRSQLSEGSLLFFGPTRESITHVTIAINETQMIEAGGGDRTTLNLDEAIRRNAFVRTRPIKSRSDFVAVLKIVDL